MIRPILLTALSLVLAGCAATTTPTTPAPEPATVTMDGFAPAGHPECAYLGLLVLRYLATGDNEGHPELDGALAPLVGEPRPMARAKANKLTGQCDRAIEHELAVKREEAREEAEREQRAAGLERARAYCTGRGGTVVEQGWCKAPRADADPARCGQWLALDADTGRLLYPDITPEECWT
jgi:hypothetical protein